VSTRLALAASRRPAEAGTVAIAARRGQSPQKDSGPLSFPPSLPDSSPVPHQLLWLSVCALVFLFPATLLPLEEAAQLSHLCGTPIKFVS